MKMRWPLALAFLAASAAVQSQSARTLNIYVVDVEGGNAVLFVSPDRGSLLIDSGNGGTAAPRDADRIMAAAKDAGITQIDQIGRASCREREESAEDGGLIR